MGALDRISHADVVHVIHLLIWPSRGIPFLHIQEYYAFALLPVALPLRDTRRVQAQLLDPLDLLLPLVLPAPDVIVRLPVLEPLE